MHQTIEMEFLRKNLSQSLSLFRCQWTWLHLFTNDTLSMNQAFVYFYYSGKWNFFQHVLLGPDFKILFIEK